MEEKYFVAKITTDIVDSESGKIKKPEKKNWSEDIIQPMWRLK